MSLRIIITGGTGFIGSSLCSYLSNAGYEVVVLTRDVASAKKILKSTVIPVQWDGISSVGWLEYVDSAHAIINLAGENIGSGRWTEKKKQRLLDSRIHAGKAVVQAISRVKNKPDVLIQASGIGIYGNRGDEILDESSSIGIGFMPDLARQWEQAVKEIESTAVRVAYLRTGVVLGKGAEFLKRILLPFRFFMGGHLGSGNQWISWIHRDDEIKAIKFLIEHAELSGTFNLSAPNPETFKNFSRILGNIINRPSWFHVPGFLLKALLGEMADELVLSGQRANPRKLLSAGFEFSYPTLEPALREIMN